MIPITLDITNQNLMNVEAQGCSSGKMSFVPVQKNTRAFLK